MGVSFRRTKNLLILDKFCMKTFCTYSEYKNIEQKNSVFRPIVKVFLSVCTQPNQHPLRNSLIPLQLHQRKPQRKMQYQFNGKI